MDDACYKGRDCGNTRQLICCRGWGGSHVEDVVLNDVIVIHSQCEPTFLVVEPREWIVELGQCGTVEILKIAVLCKMTRDCKGLRWVKAIQACFLEQGGPDDLGELAVAIVRTVKGLEWYHFEVVGQ